MALKYPVKINQVNDLSSARYAAGMGAKAIGFVVSNTNVDSSINQIKAIIQWISGVDFVLEFETNCNWETIYKAVNELNCKTLEMDVADYFKISLNHQKYLDELDVLARINFIELSNLPPHSAIYIHYKNIEPQQAMLVANEKSCFSFSPHVSIDAIISFAENYPFKYLCFNGGIEQSPGITNFGNLPEFLEAIEIVE